VLPRDCHARHRLPRPGARPRFPGSFVTCIKNPGGNTVSVDAQGTIIAVN